MQKKNCDRSKSQILRLLWDIVVFKLVAYLLNMICLIPQLLYKIACIYEFSYKFDTVLYQFLQTGTIDRCLIVIGIIQLLRFSGFSRYPNSFFRYSPLKSFYNI